MIILEIRVNNSLVNGFGDGGDGALGSAQRSRCAINGSSNKKSVFGSNSQKFEGRERENLASDSFLKFKTHTPIYFFGIRIGIVDIINK